MTEDSQEEGRAENDGVDDDRYISSGWSITVRELRAAIDGLPDDYEVMLTNAEVDDCDISNVNIDSIYPPSLESPGLLILGGGQILSSEYAYHERMDAHHLLGGTRRWVKDEWRDD